MSKLIFHGKIARTKLLAGINKAANMIIPTAGPLGKNIILEQKHNHAPLIVNDGALIAQSINFENSVLNLGANLVKQVALETNKIAGDGTTTSVILLQALANHAIKLINNGMNPINLKKQLLAWNQQVIQAINDLIKPIDLISEQIFQIAYNSSNSEQIAKILTKAFCLVGVDGIIDVEMINTAHSSANLVSGFEFESRYLSKSMINNKMNQTVEYHDLQVLLCQFEVDNFEAFLPILQEANNKNIPTLIIAKSFSKEAAALLTLYAVRKKIPVVAVTPEHYYSKLDDLFQDLSVILATPIVFDISMLEPGFRGGYLSKLIVQDNKTTLIHDSIDLVEVQEHITNLQTQLQNLGETQSADAIWLQKRIAQIESKVVLIKLAAETNIEQNEKKYRLEDAINATRHALKTGVVPGGGAVFLSVIKALIANQGSQILSDPAFNLCYQALIAPTSQLLKSTGEDESVLQKILETNEAWIGYDVLNNKITDMWQAGIFDPYTVIMNAWTKAISITAAIITTEGIVVEKPKNNNFIFPSME